MPSDAKKRKDQKKKDAAKNRNKKGPKENGEAEEVNGVNGEVTANGINGHAVKELEDEMEAMTLLAKHRACTGVLASHPESRDVHIHNLSITFHGVVLLEDTKLELNVGRRYGLIGLNGCGKSSLLSAIENREIPIPEHVDIYHLRREMPPSEKTALQAVCDVDKERIKLEHESEVLATKDDQESHDRLLDVYERLEEMDSDKAAMRASFILHGLGFTNEMQEKKVKNFSGGWRMRISLARALFIKPSLLLLDEPTNHLDLNACVWLENELKNYSRILVMISHSQDFLNGVCTNIIHMQNIKLKYYGDNLLERVNNQNMITSAEEHLDLKSEGNLFHDQFNLNVFLTQGNYDTFMQTRMELEENQMKKYKWEQDQIAHMKNYIARFGHGSAKLARQAQSKEKTLKKMVDAGLTEKVSQDKVLCFSFPPCGKIPPPVIMVQHVSFRYEENKPWIYRDLDFGFDLDTRIALVGPNGAGKSTLLKLIVGELIPTEGLIRRNTHLKIGRYHQHLAEALDLDLSALQYMMKCFPEVKEREDMRRIIGRFGLTGQQQICPIRNLSDGQRCRVTFAWLAWQNPHILLLDEPTNHLDIETIDALADAINDFEGGLILVSHDFRLISQVVDEIWICEKETVTKWEGDIFSYKENLTKKVKKENAKMMKSI